MRARQRKKDVTTVSPANLFVAESGLELLFEAWLETKRRKGDRWDFAVEMEELLKRGVSRATLRALIEQGLVEHSLEQTRPRSPKRSFQPIRNFSLPKRTCFVLTPAGAKLAEQARNQRTGPQRAKKERVTQAAAEEHPHWDGESILRGGEDILKEYRRAATMQKCILDAFEQQGWPRRIDNPLPRLSGVHRKQHLRETIKNLNRNLTRKLIVFHADGSGLGIYWTPAWKLDG